MCMFTRLSSMPRLCYFKTSREHEHITSHRPPVVQCPRFNTRRSRPIGGEIKSLVVMVTQPDCKDERTDEGLAGRRERIASWLYLPDHWWAWPALSFSSSGVLCDWILNKADASVWFCWHSQYNFEYFQIVYFCLAADSWRVQLWDENDLDRKRSL